MRLLVTGASGLLGSTIVYAGRETWQILALGHRVPLRALGFETACVDLTQPGQAERVVCEFKPDWICHCAALTNVDLCERQPALAREMNVEVTRALAGAAASCGAHMLLVSTDSVFDGKQGRYDETAPPAPVHVYGASKLEGERVAQQIMPNVLIARTNFFGWNIQNKESLAEWVLHRLERGETVPGWTDVFFTPLFTVDLAYLLLRMIELGLSGLYHVGSSYRLSKFEFACTVAKEWKYNLSGIVASRHFDTRVRVPRPADTSLDCSKLSHALGHALPDVAEGVHTMRVWGEQHLADFKLLFLEG